MTEQIRSWIQKYLPKNSIIVEAGTYDGTDTLFFSDTFPDGRIYGFEPVRSPYLETLKRLAGRTNVEIYNMALSDRMGKSQIFVSDRFGKDWGSASLLQPQLHREAYPEITFKTTVEVETIGLDQWDMVVKPAHIDLMWLDLQGYESVVIKAAPNTMKKTKFIYAEVSIIETYKGVMKYPEFVEMMKSIGFKVLGGELEAYEGNLLFENTKL